VLLRGSRSQASSLQSSAAMWRIRGRESCGRRELVVCNYHTLCMESAVCPPLLVLLLRRFRWCLVLACGWLLLALRSCLGQGGTQLGLCFLERLLVGRVLLPRSLEVIRDGGQLRLCGLQPSGARLHFLRAGTASIRGTRLVHQVTAKKRGGGREKKKKSTTKGDSITGGRLHTHNHSKRLATQARTTAAGAIEWKPMQPCTGNPGSLAYLDSSWDGVGEPLRRHQHPPGVPSFQQTAFQLWRCLFARQPGPQAPLVADFAPPAGPTGAPSDASLALAVASSALAETSSESLSPSCCLDVLQIRQRHPVVLLGVLPGCPSPPSAAACTTAPGCSAQPAPSRPVLPWDHPPQACRPLTLRRQACPLLTLPCRAPFPASPAPPFAPAAAPAAEALPARRALQGFQIPPAAHSSSALQAVVPLAPASVAVGAAAAAAPVPAAADAAVVPVAVLGEGQWQWQRPPQRQWRLLWRLLWRSPAQRRVPLASAAFSFSSRAFSALSPSMVPCSAFTCFLSSASAALGPSATSPGVPFPAPRDPDGAPEAAWGLFEASGHPAVTQG